MSTTAAAESLERAPRVVVVDESDCSVPRGREIAPAERPTCQLHPIEDPAWHWTALGGALFVLTAALLLEVRAERYVVLPLAGQPLPELCLWQRYFQAPCPGCGLTRCFISLAHGRLADAWRFHPAGILLFAAVAAQVPYRGWQLCRLRAGQAAWHAPWLIWLGWAMVPVFVVQWIVRTLG
ncbi:MAG: DUF2752 domain-containing protein [Pirellulales bacterium]|nr:DUF2752 domain-containing protein [Pirellulales bacterium]